MDKGQRTGAVFVDLSKAFDTADHACIINKLNCYGIENVEQNGLEIIYSTESKLLSIMVFHQNNMILLQEFHRAPF